MTTERTAPLPFQAHFDLLQFFIAHRAPIVERLQALLNAQQVPPHLLQDRRLLGREFEDCFFATAGLTRQQAALRGQLQEAHWAEGFRPREMPGIPNEMFDPADMMSRAFTMWQATRWPGRNGRVRFAQTLFNLYVVRCITLLGMRVWDEGDAPARLGQLRRLLDALWRSSPADQPVLVRDPRWLIPVAQSPTTDDLGAYFRVAQKLAESLPEEERLEIHRATVVMAGGHLRSQLRYFNMQGRELGEHALLLDTRRSNALDCAMTIQALVPLLAAYARAVGGGDDARRLVLAGAICQAISPDPDLFLNQPLLLRAYSMIDYLFVASDADGNAAFTPMGQRHAGLVDSYLQELEGAARALAEDCPRFTPIPGTCSPYGVMFGFSSNLLEHMTMKAVQPDAERRFTLEDVFADGEPGADKLAWVSGWRRLPHVSAEVQKQYEYPQAFAEDIFNRLKQAIEARVTGAGAAPTGRLHALETAATGPGAAAPELDSRYLRATDANWVSEGRAQACEETKLLADRNEGEFIVSFQTAGGWVALSKDVLTDVLGAGRDVRVSGIPRAVINVMALVCPGLVASA